MDKMPLVSILMTSYNREKYIGSAIQSALYQTYENWELIVLDDCSKDKTFEIAKAFSSKDSRIKVYRNDSNLGQFKNRNRVASFAEGEYLKYLDSDDLLYPFAIEQLVYYMVQYPEAGYGLCSIDQDPKYIFPVQLSPVEAYQRHYLDKKLIFHKAPLSSIIRKDAFNKAGGFPHEAVSGDFAMWLHLSLFFPVVLMPHGMIWYRVHPDQEMQKTKDNILVEFEYFKVAEYYISLDKCPLNEREKKIVLREIKSIQKRYIFWKTRTKGVKAGLKLYKLHRAQFALQEADFHKLKS